MEPLHRKEMAAIKTFRKKASRYLIKDTTLTPSTSIMQKRSFKDGDLVFYGVVRGILVGTFISDQTTKALFFSHEQREGFQTRDQIIKNKNGMIADYLIKEHFGHKKSPMHAVLDQHRFLLVSLQDLKHMSSSQIIDDNERLIRKRHLYIRMATTYMKTHKSNIAIQRICECIENVQAEIELEAARITARNKTAFASYE
jgi:hypothetical protein